MREGVPGMEQLSHSRSRPHLPVVIQDIVREEERPHVRAGTLDDEAPETAEDDVELVLAVSSHASCAAPLGTSQ